VLRCVGEQYEELVKRWTYVQSTGELIDPEGEVAAVGYSGRDGGLNKPSMQDLHDVGPIPVGFYRCCAPVYHTRLGPDAIPLVPFPGNFMFTRGGFYVHGDNAAQNCSASEGCIVIGAATRARLTCGTVIAVVAETPVQVENGA
jgi:hypothetical protein